MASLIIFSGPLGSGKTTIAQEYVASCTEPTAYIEGDLFWSFYVHGCERQPENENFRTLMRAMTNAAACFVAGGFDTVLDFSIPPWYISAVKKICVSREIPVHYIIFRPQKDICASRAAGRKEGSIEDYSTFSELYDCFLSEEYEAIENDHLDPGEVVSRVRSELKTDKYKIL